MTFTSPSGPGRRPTPFRVLALIPARSGSKGLRHKNLKKLDGVPLLVRCIATALASPRRGEDWTVVVSTDSRHYARLARRAGASVPFLRPARLARDQSRLIDAVLHTLEVVDQPAGSFDAVIMLSPTCPLRTVRDVRAAINAFKRGNGESVASVRADPFARSWRFELRDGLLDRRPRRKHVGRRQEDRGRVVLNGAIYVASPAWLRRAQQFVLPGKTRGLLMPPQRSLDIETALDLDLAELLWDRSRRTGQNR